MPRQYLCSYQLAIRANRVPRVSSRWRCLMVCVCVNVYLFAIVIPLLIRHCNPLSLSLSLSPSIDGKLTVLPDWWFDVPPTLQVDIEGRLGMRTDTKVYKCRARNACLPNKTAVPMTMYCDENHTSVMCSRCYHRREDCDRGLVASSDVGMCKPPSYMQRSTEWMYFAKVARHCERCPSGSAANMSYLLTAVVAVGMLIAISLLVLAHLQNTETRLREMVRGETARANTTGPIARLLLNWMQATSLLITIKFTPPDAVQAVGVWAEYAQVSVFASINLNLL